MKRLGLTLPLNPFEPATSYVSRLAEFNGRQYVQDFCKDIGLNWKTIASGERKELRMVAQLTGAELALLKRFTPKAIARHRYQLNRDVLTPNCYSRGHQAICPRCISEDKKRYGIYGAGSRMHWYVRQLPYCSVHKTNLTVLPAAAYPRDAHDFAGRIRDTGVVITNLRRDEPTDFEAYLAKRLEGKPKCNWLDKIDFDVVISFCEVLGTLQTAGRHVKVEQLTQFERARIGGIGFATCKAGGDGIRRALSHAQRTSDSEKAGHYTDYGPLSHWLYKKQDCPRHAPLIDIVRNHIWTNYPIGEGEIVLGKPCPKRWLHSRSSAAHAFGLSYARVYHIQRTLAAEVGLPLEQSNRFYFSVKGHSELLLQAAKSLRLKEAGKYLGCCAGVVKALVTVGLLKQPEKFHRVADRYSPKDLQLLIDSCVRRPSNADYNSDDYATIREAVRKTKLSFAEIVQLLKTEDIHHVPPLNGRVNLGSILINWRELLCFVTRIPPEGHTKGELQRILRINMPTLIFLIDEGYLTGDKVRCDRNGLSTMIVPLPVLERFLNEYVTLGIMAHQFGLQAVHVITKLEKLGIAPIPLPRRFSWIYRRRDVQAFLQ